MRSIGLLLALVAALLVCGAIRGDVVYLKNGNRIEGRILKADENAVTIEIDAVKTVIPRADVERVELEEKTVDDPLVQVLSDLMRTSPPPVPELDRPGPLAPPEEHPPGERPETDQGEEPSEPVERRTLAVSESLGISWQDILLPVVLIGSIFLACLLWGTSHILGIDEPAFFKSFLATLIPVGTFLLGYWVFKQVNLRFDEPASVGWFAAVNFAVAVISAGFIYKTSLVKAFLLWAMPLIIMSGIGIAALVALTR